jgi:hypothetical protein
MNTISPELPNVRRLFRVYNGGLQRAVERDEYGFVKPSDELFTFDRLDGFQAILILGPQWIGKSFIAERSERLAIDAGKQYVWSTKLHLHSPGQPIQPSDWAVWAASSDPALWIIDSLDEGETIQRNIHRLILRELQSVDSAAASRLQVIVFCRETALPASFIATLAKHYRDQFIAAELLPLTYEDARHFLATTDFAQVLEKIKRHNLQAATQYPAALKYVERNLDQPLSTTEIWKGVLKELLREQDPDKQKRLAGIPGIDEQFRAVSHLACIMSFSGTDTIALATSDQPGRPPHELLPEGRSKDDLAIHAARHALGSAMFAHGRRFAQKNIREWMCAFALNDMPLGQLKPLLSDGNGNLSRAQLPVISLLTQIGRQDLQDWILRTNAGLPVPSDLSALSLSVALQVVDRLEQLADTSPWSLRLWSIDDSKTLQVEGIGDELARRISDNTRAPERRIVLLQIATTINAKESVSPAIAILRNGRLPDDLVETALILAKKLATPDQLRAIEKYVRSAKPRTRVRRAVISAIIQTYLDTGYWRIEDAVMYAPDARGKVLDSTHMLQRSMAEQLTLEAARIVVQRKLSEALANLGEPSRAPAYPQEDILYRALAMILEQPIPTAGDLDPLIPLALREYDVETHLRFEFTPTFRNVEASRRNLYLADLAKSHSVQGTPAHRPFRWVLTPDDVDWLIAQLPALAGSDDSIWEDVIIAARGGPSGTQERASAFLHDHRPAVLDAFTKTIAHHQALIRQQEELRQAAQAASKRPEIRIAAIVNHALAAVDKPLSQRMWQLSRVCFPNEHMRPSDLVGTWDDLDDATQKNVLDVLQKAIRECQPTAFSASTFSQTVQYEAWCFRAVVDHRFAELNLDARLIANWLPALLVWASDADAQVIELCYRTDKTATESVFLAAIQRDIQSGSPHSAVAANLESRYWTATLSEQVATLVQSREHPASGRASLLRILASRNVPRALAIARYECSHQTDLTDAALSVLLLHAPDEAWPFVERDFAAGNHRGLFILAQLFDMSDRYRFDEWPADRLCALATMLFSIFPSKRGREQHDGFVTPEYQCRQLRDALPGILFYRGTRDDRENLQKLVAKHPFLKRWHQRVLAEDQAKKLLEPSFLPIRVIQEALNNPDYRWLRHNSDLMAVVEEQLHTIRTDIGEDAELFYRVGTKPLQPQHEGAFQAYIHRRLADRLPFCERRPNCAALGG